MSKYTTEVRFICETANSLSESVGGSKVDEIISKALPKIFDFDFPIFDESYRNVLETKIIRHYYTREIGFETVELWKLKLNTKLNEIMPYYNKMYQSELLEFNPLYTTNLTRDHKTEVDSETHDSSRNDSDGKANSQGTAWNIYSDTPQGGLQNIDNETYLTNATKDTNKSYSDSEAHNKGFSDGTSNSTEDYLEHVVGYEGKNASELLLKYRSTFINIDVMIINELEDLFLQLW